MEHLGEVELAVHKLDALEEVGHVRGGAHAAQLHEVVLQEGLRLIWRPQDARPRVPPLQRLALDIPPLRLAPPSQKGKESSQRLPKPQKGKEYSYRIPPPREVENLHTACPTPRKVKDIRTAFPPPLRGRESSSRLPNPQKGKEYLYHFISVACVDP